MIIFLIKLLIKLIFYILTYLNQWNYYSKIKIKSIINLKLINIKFLYDKIIFNWIIIFYFEILINKMYPKLNYVNVKIVYYLILKNTICLDLII